MFNYFVPPATHKFGQQAAGLLTGLCFSISASAQLSPAQERDIDIRNATGDNMPGDLGAAAGYLQLAQGLQNGDSLAIANGVNVISDGALDSAMNEAIGSSTAGEAVPYLSYALALRNFADNPEQAALTMAGTYVVMAANDEFFRSVA